MEMNLMLPKLSGKVRLNDEYKKNKLIYDTCGQIGVAPPKEVSNYMFYHTNYEDGEWIDLKLVSLQQSRVSSSFLNQTESILIEYLNNVGLSEIRIEFP